MSNDYYIHYSEHINKLKESERDIRKELENYQKISKQEGQNTIGIENKITGMLKQFKELYNKLDEAYLYKNIPGGMNDKTIDFRQKEIHRFGNNYNEIEKIFKSIQTNKYSFKNNINEDYSKKEEYKNMQTGEIIQLQKYRLNEQDDRIEDITLEAKKGTQLAKNTVDVIKEQNKQLDEMNEDIDRTREKMNSLTNRFNRYVAKHSVCKMITILIVELAIAVATGALLLG